MSRIVTRGFGSNGGSGHSIVTQGYADTSGGPSPGAGFDASHPRRELLGPGIRFANVPRGRADFASTNWNGTQAIQTNAPQGILQALSDRPSLSGVIRFRFRALPSSISSRETRNLDQFGNVIYPGTGR